MTDCGAAVVATGVPQGAPLPGQPWLSFKVLGSVFCLGFRFVLVSPEDWFSTRILVSFCRFVFSQGFPLGLRVFRHRFLVIFNGFLVLMVFH